MFTCMVIKICEVHVGVSQINMILLTYKIIQFFFFSYCVASWYRSNGNVMAACMSTKKNVAIPSLQKSFMATQQLYCLGSCIIKPKG